MQSVEEGRGELQHQLSKQEDALAGSQKLREQLTQRVISLEQDVSDAQAAQHQAVQVSTWPSLTPVTCCCTHQAHRPYHTCFA